MKCSHSYLSAMALGAAILTLAWVPAEVGAEGFPTARSQAQHIFTPMVSPGASVSQTIGVTTIEVAYHRPAVNEREIWGSLIPYDQVWRTGANENTVVSFSTEVAIEGQTLAAGTYGLHSIPGESKWTMIFSKASKAWGSYSYDQAQDALRVEVTPVKTAQSQERLSFRFENIESDSVQLNLEWGKLQVPVSISVDEHSLTLASMREQLTGLSRFFWQGWNQAASYCLQNEINYEEALEWAERSIQASETFGNLSTKAQLLEKTGDEAQAKEIIDRALGMGNGGDLFGYARSLQGQGKNEEALEVFERNVKQNPSAWFVELGLARGLSALGRFPEAAAQMKIAVGRAPENQKAYFQGLLDRLEKGEDIN